VEQVDLEMSQFDEQRASRSGVALAAWIVAGGFFLYFGVFAALIVDGPILHSNVIENSVRSVSPELHTAVGEILQVVYFPLLWVARRTGLIP
jgi:hypothetical protein